MFTAAMLAVLGAAITFAFTQVNEYLQRGYERTTKREAMLVALYGEIQTLENFLWMESSRGTACLESGIPLEIQSFGIPRDVFDANAASLGELRDSRLVAKLVELYAIAEHTNEKARRLETGNGEVNFASLRYLQDLANCLGVAVHCHAWLKKHTSHIRELDDFVDRRTFQQQHQERLNVADRLAAMVDGRFDQHRTRIQHRQE